MNRALLAAACALRAQADALVVALEEATGFGAGEPLEPGSCPNCHAGPDDVLNMDTLDGAKKRHCKRCDNEWVPA